MTTDTQRATTDLRQHPHAQFFRDNPTFESVEEAAQRKASSGEPARLSDLKIGYQYGGSISDSGGAPKPLTILAEADKIVNGTRQTDYGTGEKNLTRIAAMWSAYLGTHITARQVTMMMVLLKVSRDAHKEKRDNLVDLAGYAALADEVTR